jgi:hypothetical protein
MVITTVRKLKPLAASFYFIVIFMGLVLSFNSSCFGQDKVTSDVYYTPNGALDRVFDTNGTAYKLSEIEVAKPHVLKNGTATSSTLLCSSGIFELYFETGSGMEIVGNASHDLRRSILCQAFQDLSDFINTPLKNSGNTTKIKFWIRNPTALNMPANAGGAASSFYSFPTYSFAISSQTSGINGIVDNEIWKTIHTGVDSYSNTVFPIVTTTTTSGFYHGWASFNFNGTVDWNLEYNKYNAATAYPLNYIDFYSTIIHEVSHALGFNSLIGYNGYSSFFFDYGNYYTRYDKNLKTSTNVSLLTNAPTTAGKMYDFYFNSAVPTTTLYPNCSLNPPVYDGNSGAFNCSTAIKYVSSIVVPVYNSPCFENGSSLSHFEDACYNGNSNDQYFMMSERASGLFAKRTLTSEERQVLCDIGYSVNSTFGSASNFTYKDYGTSICAGITVAGVNDGFITATGAYAFQGNSGTNISITGILNNDYTGGLASNLRFEFVQDIYDPNAVFSSITTTSFVFKSYVPGVHLLRYVPYDIITGQRGNITYIYVNVFNNCTVDKQCSLVKNGDFENHNYLPTNGSQIYKACGWQNASYMISCDYFNSDATSSGIKVPSNLFGNQLDKINGNHAYAGMFISPYRFNVLENVYSESVKTELTNALQPNTQYQLTFDVSMAENYVTNAIKFQAFITDTNLELTTGGIIPSSYITADKVFLTHPSFSGTSSVTDWETITFTFTTGSNTNLKYLYIGGLNSVEFQNNGGDETYYYLDNVILTPVLPNGFLNAVNDDFSSSPINSTIGGVTASVYSNDLYNNAPSTSATLSKVIFSLMSPVSITGATINNLGVLSIPANTPAGTYTLTYTIQSTESCFISDSATVTVTVSGLGISTLNEDNNTIKIFPNPTGSLINLSGGSLTINYIELYDIQGRLLETEKVNKTDLQLDLSKYQIGTYFIKIKTDNGTVSRKLIKD